MTLIQFLPSPSEPFTFTAVLDDDTYNFVISWNTFGQRYYVNCYLLTGDLVFCLPLIGSPDNYDIPITAGYFTSTLIFRGTTQTFEISP